MLKKFMKFISFVRSQRLLTKIAAMASLLSVLLGFYATAVARPLFMVVAAGIAGLAAGFAVGTLRQAMRRAGKSGPPNDQRSNPGRRSEDRHALTAH